MQRYPFGALIVAVLALGCSIPRPDGNVTEFSLRFLSLLESRDSVAIVAAVDPSLTSYSAWGQLSAVGDTLRSFHRDSTTLVGWNTFSSSDTYRGNLTFALHGQDQALVALAIVRREGSLVVTGIQFQRVDTTLAKATQFHIAGKGPRFYFVVTAAAMALLICIGAAIVLVRTPMPRRWLWALLALVGFGQCTINWSTGEISTELLRVQLLGAGALRYTTGPWLVSFALPLGAIYALWRRHRFLALGGRESPTAHD
jgi:hypothetical protein